VPETTDVQQRSLEIVREFYAAKERHDLDAVASLLADDVVYNFPLNAAGTPGPWFTYDGKQATVDYQRATLARFSRIHMVDPEYTVSPAGDVVFATGAARHVLRTTRRRSAPITAPTHALAPLPYPVQLAMTTTADST
jgi:ketosteroid isomerase-like protein